MFKNKEQRQKKLIEKKENLKKKMKYWNITAAAVSQKGNDLRIYIFFLF